MNETKIDRMTTALVVIDLQKGIVSGERAPHSGAEVVRNAAALADACRKNGMPVFLVRVTPSPDGKDALHPAADVQMQRPTPPPDWAEIVPEMGPQPGDLVITKRQWGAFYGTEIDLELRRRGVRTIILCGISTNIGVESTARFAYEYGYDQILVEDACAAMSAEEHNFVFKTVFPRIGLVKKTAEVIAALS